MLNGLDDRNWWAPPKNTSPNDDADVPRHFARMVNGTR